MMKNNGSSSISKLKRPGLNGLIKENNAQRAKDEPLCLLKGSVMENTKSACVRRLLTRLLYIKYFIHGNIFLCIKYIMIALD